MRLEYDPNRKLPTAKDLPDSDETPLDDELHNHVPNLLRTLLASIWSTRMDWFFGVNMGIYYHPDEPAIVPDAFLSLGVPRIKGENLRLSYVLWEEKKVPIMMLEIVSHIDREKYTTKKEDYAQLGVLYYVIYNPRRKAESLLDVYKLINGQYELLEGEPVWLDEIGLGIGRDRGLFMAIKREWLYWYDQQGNRYLSIEEILKNRQQEKLEAEIQAQQLEKRV